METKTTASNTNLKRYLALGGIGLAVFGASYYIWRKLLTREQPSSIEEPSITEEKGLPKDLLIKILTATRRELFPIWSTMAGEVQGFLVVENLKSVPSQYKQEVLERGNIKFPIKLYSFGLTRKTTHLSHHKSGASRIQSG